MRWLLRIAVTLIVLVVLAVTALLLVPADRIAGVAAQKFTETTGRALTIEGPVRATLWPRLGVRAEGVTVANASWAGSDPMLSAQSMEIGVDAASLIGGTPRVEQLEIVGARVSLLVDREGRASWEMAGLTSDTAPAGQSSGGTQTQITVDKAVLSNAEITFVDQRTDTTWALRAVDLTASLTDGAADVDISALLTGQAVNVSASLADVQGFLAGELTPVTANVVSGGSSILLDGRADLDPLSYAGSLTAQTTDRGKALGILDIPPLTLPEGLGARKVSVTAGLTLAPEGSLHLRDMVLALDGNTLRGNADILPGDARPRLNASFSASSLDLTGLSAEGQGGETALVSDTGWGRELIDVSGLFAADASLSLNSGPITLGDATLDRVAASVQLDNGRAVVNLDPVQAYGGTVTGDVVVNGRGGLSSRAVLQLSGLQTLPFLTEFADFDRLVGSVDASVNLLGVGDTAQDLVESLDGDLSFRMGQGELLGLDIGGMVRSLDLNFRGEGQKTIFDGVSASFTVQDGVMRGDDLSLTAPLLVSTAAGRIDLGPQTLDYRLMPTLRRNADSSGVTVPISVTGPWSDPRVRPDLEFLAKQRLEVEREELEARARAEAEEARARAEEAARAKLAAELEVEAEVLTDRDAIEDVIRDRVEDQLLNLLFDR